MGGLQIKSAEDHIRARRECAEEAEAIPLITSRLMMKRDGNCGAI